MSCYIVCHNCRHVLQCAQQSLPVCHSITMTVWNGHPVQSMLGQNSNSGFIGQASGCVEACWQYSCMNGTFQRLWPAPVWCSLVNMLASCQHNLLESVKTMCITRWSPQFQTVGVWLSPQFLTSCVLWYTLLCHSKGTFCIIINHICWMIIWLFELYVDKIRSSGHCECVCFWWWLFIQWPIWQLMFLAMVFEWSLSW